MNSQVFGKIFRGVSLKTKLLFYLTHRDPASLINCVLEALQEVVSARGVYGFKDQALDLDLHDFYRATVQVH